MLCACEPSTLATSCGSTYVHNFKIKGRLFDATSLARGRQALCRVLTRVSVSVFLRTNTPTLCCARRRPSSLFDIPSPVFFFSFQKLRHGQLSALRYNTVITHTSISNRNNKAETKLESRDVCSISLGWAACLVCSVTWPVCFACIRSLAIRPFDRSAFARALRWFTKPAEESVAEWPFPFTLRV